MAVPSALHNHEPAPGGGQLLPPRDESPPVWKALRFQEGVLNNIPLSSCLPGRGAVQQHPWERLFWRLRGGHASKEIGNLINSRFSVNFC